MLKRIVLALLLITLASPAFALCGTGSGTCFWVGGGSTTNWNATVSTNWAVTSGGANGAGPPIAGDNVIFDSNSGSGTSVLNTAFSVNAIDCNGFTGTLTHNTAVTLTVTGNDAGAPNGKALRLSSGMTYTPSNILTSVFLLTATTGTSSITTAGKSIGSLTLNGTGGTFQPQDDITSGNIGVLTLTAGTYDGSLNHNITIGNVVSPNGLARTLTMGNGTWTINGTAAATHWSIGTTATVTANSSTIILSGAITGIISAFSGGAHTYNALTLSNTAGVLSFGDSNTITTLTVNGNQQVNFFTTQTIGTLNANNTSSTPVAFGSGQTAAATVTISTAGTISWASFARVTFATTSVTATNSLDAGGNGGTLTIQAPVTGGGGGHIIGGWLLRRDLFHDNDNQPLYVDAAA